MADLADLFSADSPPRAPPRSPPPREALFLSPSSTPSHTPAKRRRVDYEPEAETWNDDLGNDLDNGETIEETVTRDYTDPDHEAYNAVGREVNRMFSEAQGLSEVGVRALGEILDAPVDEGEEPKPKRLMAKIDADRLLGRWGLPALLDSAKKFKVKGKGHETRDLRRVLDVYQMWAHGMFPKGNFAYTVGRVEVVCRTSRMQSAIKGMREEWERERNPRAGSEDGEGGGDLGEGGSGRASREGSGSAGRGGSRSRGGSVEGEVRSGGEIGRGVWEEGEDMDPWEVEHHRPRGKTPLFTAHDDDGPDMDEILAMEEMEREERSARPADLGDEPPEIGEEDEW